MCFYGEHPIHILPAKVYIKVELGCTYNGRWNGLCPPYSTPPHLLTVCETDSGVGWKELFHRGMKEDLMQCHCLLLILFQPLTMTWCPAWKKHSCVPSAIVSPNRHQQANFAALPYRWTHSWENVFFFLSLVGEMASPFFPQPKGISRASATPAVTVLSTSHLSSGPLMWLTHSLWSKWFWIVGRGTRRRMEWRGLLGMFFAMPHSPLLLPLLDRKEWGRRFVCT